MSSHDSMLGRRVGAYRIEEVLGEGGMGVVFRGVQEPSGQVVAIKMLHSALAAEGRLVSRLVAEVRRGARLAHPNIVGGPDFFGFEGRHFLVTELVDGRGLDEILKAEGPLPERKAAAILAQVLDGIGYAHSLGILHCELQPSNLVVLKDGTAKIQNFSSAQNIGDPGSLARGALRYQSPEQICGRELDARSDLYALGVTLYELVSGHLPFLSEEEMELVKQIVRSTPAPPSKYAPDLSTGLEAIILQAIRKDPDQRYPTADAFLTALMPYGQPTADHGA